MAELKACNQISVSSSELKQSLPAALGWPAAVQACSTDVTSMVVSTKWLSKPEYAVCRSPKRELACAMVQLA